MMKRNLLQVSAFAVGIAIAGPALAGGTFTGLPTNPNSGKLCNKFNMPGLAEVVVIGASNPSMWTTLETALGLKKPVTIITNGLIDCRPDVTGPVDEYQEVIDVKG